MSLRYIQTLILLLDNEFGVLTRVTANIRREGWNIKSLVVAETEDAAVSRLTISVECVESTLSQVLERIRKLECVRGIKLFSEKTHYIRELILVRMSPEHAEWALKAAGAIGAKVIDTGESGLTLEFNGPPEEAEAMLSALRPYGILNAARSGVVTLEKPEARKEETVP